MTSLDAEYTRTIEELKTIYETNPDLIDIFVEGRSDVAFFKWIVQSLGLEEVNINDRDYFNIDEGNLDVPHYLNGNRDILIFVYCALAKSSSDQWGRVGFVVDRDDGERLEWYASQRVRLFVTDYRNLEMYAFNDKSLNKLIKLVGELHDTTGAKVMECLIPPLLALEHVRMSLTTRERGIAVSENVQRDVLTRSEPWELDWRSFLNRSFGSTPLTPDQRREFEREIEDRLASEVRDPRMYINGHDFARLLKMYLQKKASSEFGRVSDDIVRRLLIQSVECDDLRQEPMFASIIDFASNKSILGHSE